MKSLFVIDRMPKTCDDCPFLNYTNGVGLTICENKDRMIPDEGKPSWCPLKPIPKRKEEWGQADMGWNACIDTLEEK